MKVYNVLLHTPLGKKKGELVIDCGDAEFLNGGKLNGYLLIFGHKEDIKGEIFEDNSCLFEGRFVTLLKIVDFKAKGKITKDEVSLELIGNSGSYRLTGSISDKRSDDR